MGLPKKIIENTDIAQRTKTSLYWQTLFQGVWEIIRFGLSIAIARLLEPKDFGIMGLASIIIFWSNTISELGLSNALIRKKSIDTSHINSVFTINLMISVFLFLSCFFFSKSIALAFSSPELENVLKVLSVIFVMTSFSQISVALLKRDIDFKAYSILNFIKGFTQITISLILAIFDFGYWALVLSFVVAEFLFTLLLAIRTKIFPKIMLSVKAVKDIFEFGLWSFFIAQITILNEYIDKAIVGKILGTNELGFYEKAFSISFMPIDSISMKVNGVMFSSFSRYQNDKVKLCEQFLKITTILSTVCFPVLTGLIVIAPYCVPILFGEKWIPMIFPLKILSFGFLFRVLYGLFDSLNMATGNYKKHIQKRFIITAGLILSCAIFAIYGIEVVASIVVIANLCSLVNAFLVSNQTITIQLKKYVIAILPGAVSSLLMFFIVFLCSKKVFIEITLQNMGSLIAIGMVTYIPMAIFFLKKLGLNFLDDINPNKNYAKFLYKMLQRGMKNDV